MEEEAPISQSGFEKGRYQEIEEEDGECRHSSIACSAVEDKVTLL